MVINAQGELQLENKEEVDDDDMPSLEDTDNEQNVVVGDLLVVRRVLNVQVKEEESNQRKNLFHTRCFVMWFLCMHAIYCWGDHGSMIGGLRMMDSQVSILSLLIGNLFLLCH
jgi:hypothetical protein